MTLVVLAGVGVGLAVAGVAAGLRPRPASPASVLRSLDASREPGLLDTPTGRGGDGDRRTRRPDRVLGARLAASLEHRGWLPAGVVSAARVGGSSVEALCAESLTGALSGLLLPPAMTAALGAAGISLPVLVPAWASLALAAAGALMPLVALRSAAARARRHARTVVAGYLDLVVLCLAAGMGVEQALHTAASIPDDPYSARITEALEHARTAGETPWQALRALGEDLGVAELAELAAAVHLAGTEGARIRSTLAAKATSIRRHELAEAEAEANTVTERLFLPGALLLVGFLLFIGYPAVARITGGL